MVSTLDSHPADPGSIPLTSSYFFLFSLVISRKNLVLSIKKSKTQLKNCSFNFIILSFLCMHISHIMKKRSHKVWVISICYRFILEQCDVRKTPPQRSHYLLKKSGEGFIHFLNESHWSCHFSKIFFSFKN